VDAHLADLLHRAPTLYQGLLRASALINSTISHCQVGILQPTRSRYAYFYHSPSCDARNPAIEQIGWFGIQTLIGMVREFTGPQWQPSEIGVMVDHRTPRLIREQFAGKRIRLAQPYSYIALEKSLLSLSPVDDKAAAPGHSTLHYDELSPDFVGSFKQLLHSYVRETDFNIEVAAGLCNLSTRSLQRKLTAQGTHYSRVLDEARFDAAKRFLQDRDKSVTDISQLLGYSEPSHFSRAFRRIAGISPRMYRRQLLD
jgi:AraC-like DNA-binding protein